jgi:hypothetical protein
MDCASPAALAGRVTSVRNPLACHKTRQERSGQSIGLGRRLNDPADLVSLVCSSLRIGRGRRDNGSLKDGKNCRSAL